VVTASKPKVKILVVLVVMRVRLGITIVISGVGGGYDRRGTIRKDGVSYFSR
jgi:hypothetical protein